MRTIKKYPNRRLYDTSESAYITLAEIRQLVIRNEPVKVVDAKSGADLTRSILLQIILEEEAAGSPMFSETVLAQMIRLYGQAMQGFMGPWLEQQFKWLADLQGLGTTPEAWRTFLASWPGALPPNFLAADIGAVQQQFKKNTAQMLEVLGLKP